jgi:hypothetical protein
MRSAWPTLEHVFSVRIGSSAQGAAAVFKSGLVFSGLRYPLGRSKPGLVVSGSRCPLGRLKANRVDLLVVERWEDMVDAIPVPRLHAKR